MNELKFVWNKILETVVYRDLWAIGSIVALPALISQVYSNDNCLRGEFELFLLFFPCLRCDSVYLIDKILFIVDRMGIGNIRPGSIINFTIDRMDLNPFPFWNAYENERTQRTRVVHEDRTWNVNKLKYSKIRNIFLYFYEACGISWNCHSLQVFKAPMRTHCKFPIVITHNDTGSALFAISRTNHTEES